YRVKEWKKNETIVAGNTTNIYTVENLSENINVTVEFELIPEYTLTINIVGNGSVTVNGIEYTAPMLFSEGSEVSLSAVANASWSFEGWTGGLVSTNSSETVTINSNITITATFIQLIETIVEWTFPETGENRLASGGIDVNLDRMISRESEFTGAYSDADGNGTRAISTTKWENGTNTKYWIIDFATTGYENITLSSKQRSSNTGPRDFKVQVKLDGTDWIDVASSEIVVANNFTSGVLSDIALPEVCSNQGNVYLRWIMTSDTSVNGSIVTSVGSNRIDNIIIKGYVSSEQQFYVTFNVTSGGAPVYNAKISINNEVLYTDETGQNELLLANGTYPYTVEKDGYEAYSGNVVVNNEDQIVSINLTTGIFDKVSSAIRYYPNPVYDMLTIERENSNNVKLEIYSIEGSLILMQNFATDKLLLNLEGLKGGVYIIRLTDIIKAQTIRIVKQ
ncbi:MAG TPA: T9SS type A sorting domain-containing protein, partial [Salinivirgaceae bacterium]|nr:T9SS type A sorting domain-containing protein [Salinivirgaceae bacterium]